MKQLQKHLIIILVMGIMLAAALIGGISTFTFREISSNDNRAIMKSIQQTDMEELNDTLRVTAQTVNALTASYADIVPDDLSLLKDPEFLSAYEDKTENLGYHLLSENFKIASLYYRLSPELTNNPQAGYTVARSADGISVLKLTPVNLHKFDEDDMNHVGWYYVPVSRKEPTWLPPYYNTMMGGQCISYVRPIYKGDTLIGIVGADIDFDEFCKRINNMTAYESGFAVLFGPRGDLLFDGNRSVHIPQETIDKIMDPARDSLSTSYTDHQNRVFVESSQIKNGMRLAILVPEAELNYKQDVMTYTIFLLTAAISAILILTMTSILRRIFKMSHTDTLTGAGNSSSYIERITEIGDKINEGTAIFSVMVFDVNNLKHVNDTQGHAAGDHLIRNGYQLLTEEFPRSEIYRIGGDEFVIIMENKLSDLCGEMIRGFRQRIRDHSESYRELPGQVVLAAGMASYVPGTDNSYMDVFQRADEKMYKNKSEFYDHHPEMERRGISPEETRWY